MPFLKAISFILGVRRDVSSQRTSAPGPLDSSRNNLGGIGGSMAAEMMRIALLVGSN